MKIRTGFVSNSSSSSFCIYGAYLDDMELFMSKLSKILEKNYQEPDMMKVKKYLQQHYADNGEEQDWQEVVDSIDMDELLDLLDLFWLSDDSGNYYIGREWCTIGDDETGKQFKDKVNKDLRRIGVLKANEEAETFNETVCS